MAYQNLFIRGLYQINVQKERFVLSGENQKTSEVPFVRYHFDKETWDWLEDGFTNDPNFLFSLVSFFENKAKQFNYSCHSIEVPIDRVDVFLSLTGERAYDWNKYFVIFLRVPLTNEIDFEAIKKSYEAIKLAFLPIEGIILEDETLTMPFAEIQTKIKEVALACKLQQHRVRLCGSPFSVNSDISCITAIFGRELMSLKLLPDNAPTPSAKNQSMSHCSCLSYVNIEDNITEVPKVSRGNGSIKKDSSKESKEAKPKKPKGIQRLF